jgi:hypothetical protein
MTSSRNGAELGRRESRGQFSEEGGEGVGGELRAMIRRLWKAAEMRGNVGGCDTAGIRQGFAGGEFGEGRSGRQRNDAALTFEANFGDATVFDTRGEAEDVAADGIGDVNGSGCTWKVAGIARIFEMVEDGGRMHREKYRRIGLKDSNARADARGDPSSAWGGLRMTEI